MRMISEVRMSSGGADEAGAVLDEICELYDLVFSVAPLVWQENESEEHRRRLLKLLDTEGFGIVMARDRRGLLVGFAYGYPLAPDTRWWDGFLEPLDEEFAQERPGRTFAVIDIGVKGEFQRMGLGTKLMKRLVVGRAEERATLAVQPDAEYAHRFYRRLGWRYVGRVEGVSGESAPLFDIYWLPLEHTR
jgi:ribosomal protein S18 acetylase RimI-like enzyme